MRNFNATVPALLNMYMLLMLDSKCFCFQSQSCLPFVSVWRNCQCIFDIVLSICVFTRMRMRVCVCIYVSDCKANHRFYWIHITSMWVGRNGTMRRSSNPSKKVTFTTPIDHCASQCITPIKKKRKTTKKIDIYTVQIVFCQCTILFITYQFVR